jgi:hypothetical protein
VPEESRPSTWKILCFVVILVWGTILGLSYKNIGAAPTEQQGVHGLPPVVTIDLYVSDPGAKARLATIITDRVAPSPSPSGFKAKTRPESAGTASADIRLALTPSMKGDVKWAIIIEGNFDGAHSSVEPVREAVQCPSAFTSNCSPTTTTVSSTTWIISGNMDTLKRASANGPPGDKLEDGPSVGKIVLPALTSSPDNMQFSAHFPMIETSFFFGGAGDVVPLIVEWPSDQESQPPPPAPPPPPHPPPPPPPSPNRGVQQHGCGINIVTCLRVPVSDELAQGSDPDVTPPFPKMPPVIELSNAFTLDRSRPLDDARRYGTFPDDTKPQVYFSPGNVISETVLLDGESHLADSQVNSIVPGDYQVHGADLLWQANGPLEPSISTTKISYLEQRSAYDFYSGIAFATAAAALIALLQELPGWPRFKRLRRLILAGRSKVRGLLSRKPL